MATPGERVAPPPPTPKSPIRAMAPGFERRALVPGEGLRVISPQKEGRSWVPWLLVGAGAFLWWRSRR